MPWVVGVTFKPVTKIYYFDPADLQDLQPGEHVVVETSRGRTLGTVTFPVREVPGGEISGTLKPVVRRATAWDLVQQDQAEHRRAETLQTCRERATGLGLPMKVVDVEYNFDCSSLLVYFTAEQRVDFRNLVHDLAQLLRTRVEMRQIGVRDEAKSLGGYGRCGLSLCCASWLREFTPVSIKMAKQQDLPLNPAEISGSCGRLLCCLSYEDDYYAEARRSMPRINSTLMTPEGPGKVKQVHVLRNTVTVQIQGPNEEKLFIEVPAPDSGAAGEGGAARPGCENCPGRREAVAGEELENEQDDLDDDLVAEDLEPAEGESDDMGASRSVQQAGPAAPRTPVGRGVLRGPQGWGQAPADRQGESPRREGPQREGPQRERPQRAGGPREGAQGEGRQPLGREGRQFRGRPLTGRGETTAPASSNQPGETPDEGETEDFEGRFSRQQGLPEKRRKGRVRRHSK
jgi:cell fate regulator YaaT (PSP1 superfamily)